MMQALKTPGHRRRATRPAVARLSCLLPVFSVLLLAGCQQPAASTTPPDPATAAPVLDRGLAWLPVFPDSAVQPLIEQQAEDGVSGTLTLVAEADAREVVRFYRDELEARQFKLRISPFETPHGRGARISGHNASETQGLNATVTPGETSTTVLINYKFAPDS